MKSYKKLQTWLHISHVFLGPSYGGKVLVKRSLLNHFAVNFSPHVMSIPFSSKLWRQLNFFIYGDCIAPKLDTLKRVIKAGDGTVLATCPPYTRFMKKNHVDFCVVPMSTSSNDPWVQEFLARKIPCVTSDCLVEFVCKPGSSLSRHILFRTEDFVNKSLEKLEKFSQEFVKEIGYDFKEDLKCEFCGKSDRDEFMLICGNDSGRIGCGLGMHIDCCEPKLERVPEDDWFCDKCRVVIGRKTGKKRCVKNGR